MASTKGELKILPRLPSALLTLALDDLEKTEAMSEVYKVHMSNWHAAYTERCYVCLAGAVMAQTIGINPREFVFPEDLPDNEGQLEAINFLRRGAVACALETLGLRHDYGHIFDRDIPEYYPDPSAFKSALRALSVDLSNAGL